MNYQRYMNQIDWALAKLGALRSRNAWTHGVTEYAKLMASEYKSMLEWRGANYAPVTEFGKDLMLRGAKDWKHMAEAGAGYLGARPELIRKAFLTPGAQKKSEGKDGPARYITWTDLEARALEQSCALIARLLDESAKDCGQKALRARMGRDVRPEDLCGRDSVWVKWQTGPGQCRIRGYAFAGGAWRSLDGPFYKIPFTAFLDLLNANDVLVADYIMVDDKTFNEI